MPRLAITLCCGFFMAATLSTSVWAAGRGPGPGGPRFAGSGRAVVGQSFHGPRSFNGVRSWRSAGYGTRGWHHRRTSWSPWGDPWPWYGFGAPTGGVTIVEGQSEPARPIDPYAFENLMPRAGIQRSPTPEPTIYRIEGSRSRPVARVIRIAGADNARDGVRSRYAHAETGALLLTVPRR